jgi:hypothetical protein
MPVGSHMGLPTARMLVCALRRVLRSPLEIPAPALALALLVFFLGALQRREGAPAWPASLVLRIGATEKTGVAHMPPSCSASSGEHIPAWRGDTHASFSGLRHRPYDGHRHCRLLSQRSTCRSGLMGAAESRRTPLI